ncbi:Homoaconitate hydratase [Ceratobasidium theobromae]|uniref:Homoaconitate hydratase n=1 Tax=Ceratobasidium theobromae TaxID=1582974 RepID=A0A5N5QYL4_9AGAM|nr:Homoaconitate hydratase [Ceratobasidium theobromae]
MRAFVLLAAIAAPTLAQQSSSYLLGLLSTLNGQNLTGLASAATAVINGTNGAAILNQLSQGEKTVFAPDNNAFARLPQDSARNASLLAAVLSYHIVDGHYTPSDIAEAFNHSILRTALTNQPFANLEGNKGQVLVAERIPGDNNEFVLLNTVNAEVSRTMRFQNLIIHMLNEVLLPPGSITQAAQWLNLTEMTSALQSVGALAPLEATRGVTVFVPRGAAFTAALAQLGTQAQNTTLVSAVLANHIINGTSLYSPAIALHPSNFLSAGGQPFSFMTNSSGTYVTSGPATARIIRSDVTVTNGVIHVISDVLVNSASNPAAAASAAVSQSSVAATATTTPGPAQTNPGSGSAQRPARNASIRTTDVLPTISWVLVIGMGTLLGGVLVL